MFTGRMTGHESPDDGHSTPEAQHQKTTVSINMERAVKLAQILGTLSGNGADYLAHLIEAQVDSIDLDNFRSGSRELQTAVDANRTIATSHSAGRKNGIRVQEPIRRDQILAHKINLLLATRLDESGRPYNFHAVADGTRAAGYMLTQVKWLRLRKGQTKVVPDACLQGIAAVFDVDPEYLLREDAPLPPEVEVMLPQARINRLAEIRDFATRALAGLDPEVLREITEVIDDATRS
ncbi:hypothetical protein [Arthrobacter flavus]|uniref:XRE family transcriptional regulator n=1 Tax=Arthrobacter flavus TaxID=95172 RepID=A0ABW4Q8L4_9MICC